MDGMVDMKKTICILIVICLCSLALYSCGIDIAIRNVIDIFEHRDDIIDISNGINYNGHIYRTDRSLYGGIFRFYDMSPKVHKGEKVGHFIDFYGALGNINTTCETDFHDNILKLSYSGGVDFAFKSGFSLPEYKTVKLKKLYISSTNDSLHDIQSEDDLTSQSVEIASFSRESNTTITDIVDFDVAVLRDNIQGEYVFAKMYIAATLQEYNDIYIGFWYIYTYNNNFYVLINDSLIKNDNSLYKIRDDYVDLIETKFRLSPAK